jgi:uncharacterized protein YndB with AHSA1/START domain
MGDTHAFAQPPDAAGDPGDGSDARLVLAGTRPAVRFERVFAASPPRLWVALTEPEGLRGWFPFEIQAQRWRVGGALTFTFPGHADYTTEGVVLECDPARTLAYLWGQETLRFEISPVPEASGAGAGTRLVMLDELSAPVAARNAAGWHLCLDRLAAGLAGPGEPDAGGAGEEERWQGLFARYRARFEPELGPQEGPPQGREPGGG